MIQYLCQHLMKMRESNLESEVYLHALVDGLQYEQLFDKEITYLNRVNAPLFREFGDAAIAFAGPWLFDLEQADEWFNEFSELEQAKPAVSWLITALPLDKLTIHLQQQLNVELPDGRIALLRYYDPRVLHKLSAVFTDSQLDHFTRGIINWLYQFDGQIYSFGKGVFKR